ncbi:hypothetical protein ACJX0J_028942, partial [Zea mays]
RKNMCHSEREVNYIIPLPLDLSYFQSYHILLCHAVDVDVCIQTFHVHRIAPITGRGFFITSLLINFILLIERFTSKSSKGNQSCLFDKEWLSSTLVFLSIMFIIIRRFQRIKTRSMQLSGLARI